MRSVNKVIIIGNLTRDPEMRQTPNGQNVVTFGVATNREWMTRNSERKNSAEFHECVAWAHLAEICQKYLHKGNLVYVEGYLKTRNWETPEGQKKFKTEIVVQDMIMLEKRKSEDGEFIPREESYGTETAEEVTETAEELETTTETTAESTPEASPESTPETAPEKSNSEDDLISKDLGL